MRVVLDSNVVIAAFATRGLCADVLEYCLYEQTVVLSKPLLDEIHRNLCQKIKIPKIKADDAGKFLSSEAEIVEPVKLSKESYRHSNDVKVLGIAVAGKAEVIVTGDKDLLTLRKFCSTHIFTPRDFWEFVQKNAKE